MSKADRPKRDEHYMHIQRPSLRRRLLRSPFAVLNSVLLLLFAIFVYTQSAAIFATVMVLFALAALAIFVNGLRSSWPRRLVYAVLSTLAVGAASIALLTARPSFEFVSTPSTLTASASSTSVALEWHGSRGLFELREYVLTRDGDKIYAGTQTTFVDEAVDGGYVYVYAVYAVATSGKESGRASTSVRLPTESPALATPRRLSAVVRPSGDVDLTWLGNASRYAILRDGVKIGESTRSAFTDVGPPAGVHGYTVRATDGQYSESADSSEAVVDPAVPDAPIAAPTPGPSGQRAFQIESTDDRTALRVGSAFATSGLSTTTADPVPLRVIVCGADSPTCASDRGSSTALDPPRLGSVTVGARVRADLRSGYDDVSVAGPLGPDVQPVLTASDKAEWRWMVYAHASGHFALTLSFSVLAAGSDELLLPTQLFDITVDATTTTTDRLANAARAVWAFASTVEGIVSTLAGLGVLAIIAKFWRSRRRGRVKRRLVNAEQRTTALADPTNTTADADSDSDETESSGNDVWAKLM